MASWTNLPQFQVTTATSIARMDQLLDNIITSSSHSHTGADGQGAALPSIYALGTNANQSYSGAEDAIFPFLPASQGNWDRVVVDGAHKNGGIIKTTATVSASGASIAWIYGVTSSAIRVRIHVYKDSTSGCIAGCFGNSQIQWGDSSTSILNLYSAASTVDTACGPNTTFADASDLRQVRLQVIGKDTSSTGYHAGISAITFTY